MSFITSKTYVLANGVNYTAGMIGIANTISLFSQPTSISPGPFTDVTTISTIGNGLTVDITTIDGIVKTITGYTSTAGAYTQGNYSAVASTTGGGGTGLLLNLVVDVAGDITAITIDNGGDTYIAGDTITIAAGGVFGGTSPADDVLFLVDTIGSEINTVSINKPGSKYFPNCKVIIDEGSANGVLNIDSITDGLISDNESSVMNIHILATNTADVIITHTGGGVTTFPVGSLIAGATYPYSVQSIVLDAGDANSILGMAPNGKVRFF